jgi:glycosyltransferase involved in cell wall biosynthesis
MPRHNDVATDRLAEPHHVKLVEERFKEVVNDENFLNFISKNAREYYENNLSSKNRVKKTLEILEL